MNSFGLRIEGSSRWRTAAAIRGARPALSLAVVLTLIAAGAERQDPNPVERGKFLYEVYCVNCHGQSGKGDGPTAEVLKIQPADLTRISQDNGGEYPADRVRRAIDGRQETRGHSLRRMPIWGLTFQELDKDTNQEQEVRQKIDQLIRYLETIQGRDDGSE